MSRSKNKVKIQKRKNLREHYAKIRKARLSGKVIEERVATAKKTDFYEINYRESELFDKFIGERIIMAGKIGPFETNYENNTYEINITRYSLDSIIYEINGIKEALSQATRIEFRKLIELNMGNTHNIPVAASTC